MPSPCRAAGGLHDEAASGWGREDREIAGAEAAVWNRPAET